MFGPILCLWPCFIASTSHSSLNTTSFTCSDAYCSCGHAWLPPNKCHGSSNTISSACSDSSYSCGHASSLPQVTVQFTDHHQFYMFRPILLLWSCFIASIQVSRFTDHHQFYMFRPILLLWSCFIASTSHSSVHRAPSVLHVQTHLAPVVMLHCFHTSVSVHRSPSVLHVQTHVAPVVMLHCIHTSVSVHRAPSVLHVQTHLDPVVMLHCIHTGHSSLSTISYTCLDLSCLCGHASLLTTGSGLILWPGFYDGLNRWVSARET